MVGVDRDGIAITNVFMNGELLGNSPPSEPGDLRSGVTGGRVVLSWSPAVDEQTLSEGLTYNLRVGSESGAGDVISVPVGAGARPVRSSPGNVGSNTSWAVQNLSNGTYYWSVQAVDNSYYTSSFSTEASFEITEASGTKPVSDEAVPGAPGALRLGTPYPNPIWRQARIEYDLPISGPVRVEIFDVIGRRLNMVVDQVLTAGPHSREWDGRDSSGKPLAAGIYVIRLTAGGEVRSAAATLVR